MIELLAQFGLCIIVAALAIGCAIALFWRVIDALFREGNRE